MVGLLGKCIKIILLLVAIVLFVFALDSSWFGVPPIGKIMSPQHGFWNNAEPASNTTKKYELASPFYTLQDEITIVVDNRAVPHIFAYSYEDALFAQGYMHAKDRLFQMELIVRFAEGRLCEWFGKQALEGDKIVRQMGIPLAAERMEFTILKHPQARTLCKSYVAGINFYLSQLSSSDYPVEYKLLDIHPEVWSTYKVSLAMKYFSLEMTDNVHDIQHSFIKDYVSQTTYENMFPRFHHFLDPIIPDEENKLQLINALPPLSAENEYLTFGAFQESLSTMVGSMPSKEKAFNYPSNPTTHTGKVWAIGKNKSASGMPILCNAPQSLATLPSKWYEVQLYDQTHNVYGLSIPGIPFVMIGFNEDIAWGIASTGRDMLDYYQIEWEDKEEGLYMFGDQYQRAVLREETYDVRHSSIVYDSFYVTHVGPTIKKKDIIKSKSGEIEESNTLAVKWAGHEKSNELFFFYLLSQAKSIEDYQNALSYLKSPALNVAFASRDQVAITQQGLFPMKWEKQGDFIMPLAKEYEWKRIIPSNKQPQLINPQRGYVSAAHQNPYSHTAPYDIRGQFSPLTGAYINKSLDKTKHASIEDMKSMLANAKNNLAELAILTVLGSYVKKEQLSQQSKVDREDLLSWDFDESFPSEMSSMYHLWWSIFEKATWDDELAGVQIPVVYPQRVTLIEHIIENHDIGFIDDKTTEKIEDIYTIATNTFAHFSKILDQLRAENINWWKEEPYNFVHSDPINIAYTNYQNIVKSTPNFLGTEKKQLISCRFLVALGEKNHTGYVAYLGGQSGNIGSNHYDDFVGTWEEKKYYQVHAPKHIDELRSDKIYTIKLYTP